jgi:hypothetical protein
MIPIKQLTSWLDANASKENYLFPARSLKMLFHDHSDQAVRALLSRAARDGVLKRVCHGIYLSPRHMPHDGRLLFHTAAILRAGSFNYLSLETVLSETGVISQVQMGWISVMTTGRSGQISCKGYGTIEFIHTKKSYDDLVNNIVYDPDYRMWRALVPLALKDMRATRRSTQDLIDWEEAREHL